MCSHKSNLCMSLCGEMRNQFVLLCSEKSFVVLKYDSLNQNVERHVTASLVLCVLSLS